MALLLVALLINLLLLGYLVRSSIVAFNAVRKTNDLLTTTIQMQAEIRGTEAALYRYLIEGEQGFANQFISHFTAFGQELREYQAAAISSEDITLVNQLLEVYQEANELGNTLLSLHDQQQVELELFIAQQAELTGLLGGKLADTIADDSTLLKALDEIQIASYELGQAVATYIIIPDETQRLRYTQAVISFRKNLPLLQTTLATDEEQQLIDQIQVLFEQYEQTGIKIIVNHGQQQELFANFADVFYLSGQQILLGAIQPNAEQALIETENQLQQALLLSVGGSLATAILIVVVTVRLTQPLIRQIRENLAALARGAERITNGNFSELVDIPGQDDELSSLTKAMNVMMSEIEGRENQLQAQISEFEMLRKINLELTSSLDLDQVLNTIVSSALQLVNAAEVHIFLQEEGVFNPKLMASAWASKNHPPTRMPRPDGLVSTVARTMKTEVINQANQHELYSSPEIESWGIRAGAAFPLMEKESILGVFYISYNDRDFFSDDDLRIIQLLVDQATVALQNARLYLDLVESESRLQEMAQKMMTVQEAERHLVGLDLHDGLTQLLLSTNMHLNTLASLPLKLDDLGKKEFSMVRSLIQDAIEEVRQVVSELRPSELNDGGLVESIRQYLLDSRETRKWQAEFNASPGNIELASMVEIATFRIIQEALNNAYKHGKTKKVRVSLGVEDTVLVLSVKDWGCGFSAIELKKESEKLGLIGMQERATLLKGTCKVISAPGEGTEVLVRIPIISEI
jgi:signal transduction histidine kinase